MSLKLGDRVPVMFEVTVCHSCGAWRFRIIPCLSCDMPIGMSLANSDLVENDHGIVKWECICFEEPDDDHGAFDDIAQPVEMAGRS